MSACQSWVILSLVLFLSATFPVQAADQSDLINGHFDATSKKERNKIARDLSAEVQMLAQYLSSPKPQDSAWVKQELAAINQLGQSEAAVSRRVQLVKSPEFQYEQLYTALTSIQNALTCAANPSNSLSKEMMCWDVAGFLLTDNNVFNDSIPILFKAGHLPRDDMIGDKSLGFGFFYAIKGRGIQQFVVIPYLIGQAK